MNNKRLFIVITIVLILFTCGCAIKEDEGGKIELQPNNFISESVDEMEKEENFELELENNTDIVRRKSILDLLKTAIQPVGSTMYVWGGGWNEEDTGAGVEAVSLGVSARWKEFSSEQDASYDYRQTRYQIHDGLDCSGYVGWVLYNVLEKESGREGYVLSASKMAETFAKRGFGKFIPAEDMSSWKAGDIMSMKGHVWIVVGMCEDGSVLFLHASPPGVMFSGTKLSDGSKSQAVHLAEKIMQEQYPDWYSRYPECARGYNYITDSSAMRWDTEILSDDENIREMKAEAIVEELF